MPRSNYTKIFSLLSELSNEDEPKDLFQFAEEIREKEIDSFVIFLPGPEPGSPPTRTFCSDATIRRLARFAADLGFVEIDAEKQCSLTSYGESALREDNYATVLATHLAVYLKENAGVTYSEIKNAIDSVQRPQVPSFDIIYGVVTSDRELQIGEGRFRMVLYLLERCGMLTTMIRKVYFAPETQAW
ncbi:hypothetical protein ACFLWA_05455 [Chloroflexota bacterium]